MPDGGKNMDKDASAVPKLGKIKELRVGAGRFSCLFSLSCRYCPALRR
jgi:hypothetical protein